MLDNKPQINSEQPTCPISATLPDVFAGDNQALRQRRHVRREVCPVWSFRRGNLHCRGKKCAWGDRHHSTDHFVFSTKINGCWWHVSKKPFEHEAMLVVEINPSPVAGHFSLLAVLSTLLGRPLPSSRHPAAHAPLGLSPTRGTRRSMKISKRSMVSGERGSASGCSQKRQSHLLRTKLRVTTLQHGAAQP